jgi:hypothetical protein
MSEDKNKKKIEYRGPGTPPKDLGTATLTPEGILVLPALVMDTCVGERTVCRLWFEEQARHVGVKLGAEGRPDAVPIEVAGEGPDRTGRIDLKRMLSAYKAELPPEPVELPVLWKEKLDFLEVSLTGSAEAIVPMSDLDRSRIKSVLDDYEPL